MTDKAINFYALCQTFRNFKKYIDNVSETDYNDTRKQRTHIRINERNKRKMKVRINGKFEEIEIGKKVFVGICGSGHSVFGEYATLVRATKTTLVFETESGSIVKTQIGALNTVGKAAKSGYFVSAVLEREFLKQRVHYWNDNKVCMEYK